MKTFINRGHWWNDSSIELVEIDGVVYALYGWNGEAYCDCWVCKGEWLNEADDSAGAFVIRPIYEQTAEDEFEIVGYEVGR